MLILCNHILRSLRKVSLMLMYGCGGSNVRCYTAEVRLCLKLTDEDDLIKL